jgi:acetamidase/formamidase
LLTNTPAGLAKAGVPDEKIQQSLEDVVEQKTLNLDRKHLTAEFLPGIVNPLHPFFGSLGVAPAPDAGRVSSWSVWRETSR